MMNMKRILQRAGLRILPVLLILVTRSGALADMAWEPDPGPESAGIHTRRMIRIIFICIIVFIWLLAKARMLNNYEYDEGWLVFVPFYGRYLEYKNYWKAKYYFINIFVLIFTFRMFLFSSRKAESVLMYAGLAACVTITVLMRIKTMEAFGQKKLLGLLELLGLGIVLDCICAIACIQGKAERKQVNQVRQQEPDKKQE